MVAPEGPVRGFVVTAGAPPAPPAPPVPLPVVPAPPVLVPVRPAAALPVEAAAPRAGGEVQQEGWRGEIWNSLPEEQ